MPDWLDRIQDAESMASEKLNASARLPDAAPVAQRDCYCGEPIDPRRLAAMPMATTCISCAQRAEQRGMHHR